MRQAAGNPGRGRKAFSLLELAMVLFIMGVIVAIAMPRYANSLASYRATLAARRIAADLALARQTAWATGASRVATFTQASSRYQLVGASSLERTTAPYVVDLAAGPYCATLQAVSLGGATSITFDGYGFPDRGGQIVVQSGSSRKTVVIDPATGNATLQ